jgi:hypothetical protein
MDPYLAVGFGLVLVGCGYLLGVTSGFVRGIQFTLEQLSEQGHIDLDKIKLDNDK